MKKRRSRPNLTKTRRVVPVGVCWYSETEWAKVKATAEDPDHFERTFAEWRTMMESRLPEFMEAGIVPVKILVTADELSRWCRIHNKKNNGPSRAAFVAEKFGQSLTTPAKM